MAKKTTDDKPYDASTAEDAPEGTAEASANTVSLGTAPAKEEPINFHAWAAHKQIPPHHMPGMLAFTAKRLATESEWEEIFQAY